MTVDMVIVGVILLLTSLFSYMYGYRTGEQRCFPLYYEAGFKAGEDYGRWSQKNGKTLKLNWNDPNFGNLMKEEDKHES